MNTKNCRTIVEDGIIEGCQDNTSLRFAWGGRSLGENVLLTIIDSIAIDRRRSNVQWNFLACDAVVQTQTT
jgi:hypothetical protein